MAFCSWFHATNKKVPISMLWIFRKNAELYLVGCDKWKYDSHIFPLEPFVPHFRFLWPLEKVDSSWSCQTAYLNMKWHTYQARWLQKALRLNLLSMLLYVKASIKMKPTLMKPPLCWQWRIISEPRSRHTLFTSCSSLAGKRGLSCLIPEMFRHFYGELLISA